MNLKAREYRFFSDIIEFYEGFLNTVKKVVRYDRITDITLTKSVWERIWNTGSIFINTAGSIGPEVKISYIEKPEETYQYVQKLIKRFSKSDSSSSTLGVYG